jgi:hypothetical protein
VIDTLTRVDEPSTALFDLPGGYRDAEGRLHREVALRPITGREEELLANRAEFSTMPALVTRMIAQCVQRLGPFEPLPVDTARRLLVADRDFLLLKLRQLTFGSHVQAVQVCPACHQKMDLDFELDQVPVEVKEPPLQLSLQLITPAGGSHLESRAVRRVEFRLPVGADLEYLAGLPQTSAEELADGLLERCLERVEGEPPSDSLSTMLDVQARREIEARMQAAAPAVDLEMDIHCPECGHTFELEFDLAAFFLEEIKLRRDQLYREVHILAVNYHWPESEILALTRSKRRLYLGLISEMQQARAGVEG